MSLSFIAAIQILDEAIRQIGEAQNMQAAVEQKLKEAIAAQAVVENKITSAMGMQRQTGDIMEEALNKVKMVNALGPQGIEGLGNVMQFISDQIQSATHHGSIQQLAALRTAAEYVRTGQIPICMKTSEGLRESKMEQAKTMIEEVKGS